jgi:hypothetical protein
MSRIPPSKRLSQMAEGLFDRSDAVDLTGQWQAPFGPPLPGGSGVSLPRRLPRATDSRGRSVAGGVPRGVGRVWGATDAKRSET